MGKKKPTQRITEYYTSIQYAICHGPVEKLISLRVNDKVIGNCSQLRGPIIYIDSPNLFGGEKKEGGLRGRIAWQDGSADQLIDAYVAKKKGKLPTQLPGYRGIATAFFTEAPPVQTETTAPSGISGFLNLFPGLLTSGGFFNRVQNSGAFPGFYWSANQPIIPATHFRVTRIDRSWRQDIAAIPGEIDVARYAICIAIDVSFSMDISNRLGLAKTAVITLLNDLKNNPQAATFDIRVVGWSFSVNAMQRRNCTPADYDALIAFVQSLSTSSGTQFTNAVSGLADFYDGAEGKCRQFVFLTDGEPNDPANATAASEILQATGADAYAFNLILTNTAETQKMDNTPSDGVPVVGLDLDPVYLKNFFRATTTQQTDMNPAHIIRECLVNGVWGLGLPESALDMDMFEAAAETLFVERFGLSMMWTRQASIQDFVGDILSHIQGTIYVNPMNGKISLKLIRNDYDPASLDILDPSNCKVVSFKRRSPAEVTNEVNVTWTNPSSEKEEVITLQSLGSIVANNGEIVSDNRNYHGVRRAELAAEICARDLAASTAPLSSAEVEADRRFSRKVPGDVVKLTDPENGVEETIMRIMKVNYGRPGDSAVLLTLTEDVFSYAKPRFVQPPGSQAPSQSELPLPPTFVEVMSVSPYMNLTSADGLDDLEDSEAQVAFFVATTHRDTFNIEVAQETVNTIGEVVFESAGEFDLVGRAYLPTLLSAEPDSEVLLPLPAVGSNPTLGGFAVIGPHGLPEDYHEIALISAVNSTTGVWTLTRGVTDTIPREWPAGTPVRYLDGLDRFINPTSVTVGLANEYKFFTKTSRGVLPDSQAPLLSYTPTDRIHSPARPANVTVAGASFGVVDAEGLITVDVTWSNRNRLTEDGVILRWTDASVDPEIDQVTVVQLFDFDTGFKITEHEVPAGTTYSFPVSDRGYSNAVLVKVISRRGDFDSIQGHGVILEFPGSLRLVDDNQDERVTESGQRRRTEG